MPFTQKSFISLHLTPQRCNLEVGQQREALAELHTLLEQGTSELVFETRWKGGGAKLK